MMSSIIYGGFARALTIVLGLLMFTGCQYSNSEGSMRTQSGEFVTIQQDYVGERVLFKAKSGKPYYYENGAKVYVNQGDGLRAPDRPTKWDKD